MAPRHRWTHDRHHTVDDTPYGGGAGMVMKPEPWGEALDEIRASGEDTPLLLVPTPSGERLTQPMAAELSREPWLLFACGRYEGIDQRVVDDAGRRMRVREISIGDYVLNGGEVAALVVVAAVTVAFLLAPVSRALGGDTTLLLQALVMPVADILPRLTGKITYDQGRAVDNSPHIMKFWRDNASYPYQSHELWFLVEGVRWGKFNASEDLKGLVAKVNREDLWREAAAELAVPAAQIPQSTSRGVEKFFDGKIFDPANPEAYLASLAIKRAS